MKYVDPTNDIANILSSYREVLGVDYNAYLNHCVRVAIFCGELSGRPAVDEVIVVAASFHDLGIWTEKTFDYLSPSRALAQDYLKSGPSQEKNGAEISDMIEFHHKITSYSRGSTLVESFRKADLVDVSQGLITFGLKRELIKQVQNQFPSHGFFRLLRVLMWKRLKSHPFKPLPMMRF